MMFTFATVKVVSVIIWPKDCRGFSNCKAEIKKITIAAAKESGKHFVGMNIK